MDEALVNRNKNINRGFQKLDIWKEAVEMYALVRNKMKLTNNLSFKVKAQIEDSILSCSSNIAEGYARRSLKENIQFNTIALASLAENYSQIFSLLNAGDIDKEFFDDYDARHYKLENKLINLNRTVIEKLKTEGEWKNDYKSNQ